MDKLLFTIALLPPSVNHQYIQRGQGGRALSEEAKAFRKAAILQARNAAQLIGWEYTGERLALTAYLFFSSKRKADIDNRGKALLDAIALALGFDDECIDRITLERAGYARNDPHCYVILEAIP